MKIEVERKRIKNMYLKVLPPDGRVKMTVPLGTTEREIREFAAARAEWIEKSREKVTARSRKADTKYETGGSFFLWGREYMIEISGRKSKPAAEIKGDRFIINVPKTADQKERKAAADGYRRAVLAEEIDRLKDECQLITGRPADQWRIRDMKTKWGTCNIDKKRIWLSLNLTQKPKECLRYVMIHELTHLYTRFHDAEFKSYMDRFCPDWREIKKSME